MESVQDHIFALIFAGGGGTRLWPLSRQGKPKQFLKLFSKKTLLQEIFDRVKKIVKPPKIFVITRAEYVKVVKKELPFLPPENIIAEPALRSTGPAVFTGSLAIWVKDKDAIIFNVWGDHKIEDEKNYAKAVLAGAEVVADGKHLLTVGLTPTFPHTGLGYIRKAEIFKAELGIKIYRVRGFIEKPKREVAQDLLDEGDYLWNVGLYIWRASAILASFSDYAPEIASFKEEIEKSLVQNNHKKLREVYQKLPEVSIDKAIAEKANNLLVIAGKFNWSDVGDFEVLWEKLPNKDKDGNVVKDGNWVGLDTQGGLFISETGQLIASIGLTNMAIVVTGNAVLVVPRDEAQKVKNLVEELRRQKKKAYL